MIGSDQGDRLALVADLVERQHRLVGHLHAVGLGSGHVLMREHRMHAGHGAGLARVDGADARGGMRAAQGGGEHHPVDPQIRGVCELARDLEVAVRPRHARPDPAGLTGFGALQQRRHRALRGDVTATVGWVGNWLNMVWLLACDAPGRAGKSASCRVASNWVRRLRVLPAVAASAATIGHSTTGNLRNQRSTRAGDQSSRIWAQRGVPGNAGHRGDAHSPRLRPPHPAPRPRPVPAPSRPVRLGHRG